MKLSEWQIRVLRDLYGEDAEEVIQWVGEWLTAPVTAAETTNTPTA